uniref:Retrovirus-related Pol polyprotein from transposon opus n=1 Tax=Cajanus cajan TaxID=3821 RepID=A0A151UAR3_CAJCA|nr:Retrovirus-related Pol polyprotein from transposon opus [Cajanus cajan]
MRAEVAQEIGSTPPQGVINTIVGGFAGGGVSFHQQIGRNMEVYVDDMVVKTTSATNHATNLAEVFAQVRKHNMRLNPEKCVFGVQGGKFLSFMITSRGIEANPEKCKAIIQMQSPQTVKEVQRLAGRFKTFLTTPPILKRPDHNTDLLLYLA